MANSHPEDRYIEPDVHRDMFPLTRFIRLPLIGLEISASRDFRHGPKGWAKRTKIGLHRSATLDAADKQWEEFCHAEAEQRQEWEAAVAAEHGDGRSCDDPYCDRPDCLQGALEHNALPDVTVIGDSMMVRCDAHALDFDFESTANCRDCVRSVTLHDKGWPT